MGKVVALKKEGRANAVGKSKAGLIGPRGVTLSRRCARLFAGRVMIRKGRE